jgi:hypothetical protein
MNYCRDKQTPADNLGEGGLLSNHGKKANNIVGRRKNDELQEEL